MLTAVPRAGILACALALGALGAAYQIKGNIDLLLGEERGAAVDLRNRDKEHALFVRGQNPFDHMEASQPPWGYPIWIGVDLAGMAGGASLFCGDQCGRSGVLDVVGVSRAA